MSLKGMYYCKKCLNGIKVDVRDRLPDEDIEAYVEHVVLMCRRDHSRRAPSCPSRTLDISVPITQSGIGFNGPELTEQDKKYVAEMLKKPMIPAPPATLKSVNPLVCECGSTLLDVTDDGRNATCQLCRREFPLAKVTLDYEAMTDPGEAIGPGDFE